MASLASSPTRLAVQLRLLVGQQLTPSIVVELPLPLLFDNVVVSMREQLKLNFPPFRSKLNALTSPKHNSRLLRLFLLFEGTALEILPENINKKVVNDAQLIFTVDGHDTTQVLQALQSAVGMTRHARTESGNITPQSGLGKRAYRSYTMRLRIASDMGRYGAITASQKALLKDLVIAGDRQLETLLEKNEQDTNPEALLSFLSSPAAQAARAKSRSQLGDSLSRDLKSLSVDNRMTEGGVTENESFDFDAVMDMGARMTHHRELQSTLLAVYSAEGQC